MSDNPFTNKPAAPAPASKPEAKLYPSSPEPEVGFSQAEVARGFSRLGWVALAVMTIASICFLVGWYQALDRQHQLADLKPKLDAAQNALAGAMADNAMLKAQLDALQKQVADLQQEKAMSSQMAKGLEEEMRSALESKDVTISKLQGKLTVSILDRVLFDSGEADLKPAGAAVMRQMAAFLTEHPELKIHVIVHTDNVPITLSARNRFASNWELSTARALAAVHFLTERAGMDARRVGAVGYGEFRPVADNATAEGRAKNRRIAIVILPDELAAADVPTTNAPDAGK